MNNIYIKMNEINKETFIGIIENVKDEKEALKKAKTRFRLATVKNVIAQECFIEV